MASGRFPPWTVVRPLLGIVLALALVTLVVGRATGLIGDATGDSSATSSVADGPTAASSATPSPATEDGGDDDATDDRLIDDRDTAENRDQDGKRDRDQDRDRDGGQDRDRDRGQRERTSWADGTARDPELVQRVEELLEAGRTPARFRVSTLNVLGAGHTTSRGNKPWYADGATRIGWIARLLHENDVDVVGFQEYEPLQHRVFKRRTGDRYEVFPGSTLGRNAIRNSIAWERSTWDVVSTHTIPIPYFRGNRVPMPYVLLEHVASGRQVWFINIHNPASNRKRGDNQKWRNVATNLEIGLMRQLRARTGHPVVLMGDFNEREEAFCAVTRRAGAVAANGGTAGPPCVVPRTTGIDWIFGTRDIAFSGYARMRGGLVGKATDHPMIVTDAELLDSPAP